MIRSAITLSLLTLSAVTALAQMSDRERIDERFGSDFEIIRTEHWAIVYSTDEEQAQSIGHALERTLEVYSQTFRDLDFELDELDSKLLCVIYKSRVYYEQQMKKNGKPVTIPTYGGFSSSRNRITLIVPPDEMLKERKASFESIAVHEATHQLSYNLGPLGSGSFPEWLKEGLASAFETVSYTEDFGPLSDGYSDRVRMFKPYVEKDEYMSLKRLIVKSKPTIAKFQSDPSSVEEDIRNIYFQGASVVTYLLNEHLDGFKTYLTALKARKKGSSKNHWRQAFKKAFPDIEELEIKWKNWALDQYSVRFE